MDEDALEYLLTRIENRIARSFRSMVRQIQDDNKAQDIALRLSHGHQELLDGIDEAAQKLAIDINAGYVQAGQRGARWLDGEVDARVVFDHAAEEVVGWMQDQAETLVRAMVTEQQDVARRVGQLARSRGLNDADAAREIQRSIGLNLNQVDFVESYRNAIETKDYTNALDRELANGRYDAALERASELGTDIAPERVDAMVDAYRDNWVGERGDFIAEQEGQSAMNAGIDESISQADAAGDLDGVAVGGRWITVDDSHVRSSHRRMHGQERAFGETFRSGDGNDLRYPGDEDVPFSDTAGCRCKLVRLARSLAA